MLSESLAQGTWRIARGAGEKTLAGVEKAIRQEGNKSSDQEAPKQDAAAPPPALETKSGASNGEFATEHLVNISEH